MNNPNIRLQLKKMGLSEREVELVAYLLRSGAEDIGDISRQVNIPRSSIYRYVDQLEQKGWVKQVLTKHGKQIELTNLSSLQAQLAAKKEQVSQEEQVLEELIRTIRTTGQTEKHSQMVRYYEGESGMRQIHWNATYTAQDEIRVLTRIITRDLVGDEWYAKQLMEAQKKQIPIRILVDTRYAKKFKRRYGSPEKYYEPISEMSDQIDKRVLAHPALKIMGKIMIFNNVIAALTDEGGKLTGSEIVSDHLSLTMKSMFDVLWGMTKRRDRLDEQMG